MSKSDKKLEALSLRRQGNSIKDIAKALNVSRSTVSVWCQEVSLTEAQKEYLFNKQVSAGNAGRQKGAEVNRQKRIAALDEAALFADKRIKVVSKEQLLFIGLGLYWGEGIKSRSGPAAIVNSDPKVLKVAKLWFLECMEVTSSDFRPYIYIARQHIDREEIIIKYWVKELGIPRSQFKSPIYINQKPMQKYENHDSYYGVVSLRILKSTNLKYRIMALLEGVSKILE